MIRFALLKYAKKVQEHDDVYTFYFTSRKKVRHNAGQHGVFMLPGLYRPHPFTISSAPHEEYLTFTTHVGTGSRFKKRLMNMPIGAVLFFVGPLLSFTFSKKADRHVLLAQGVGITPFRSMLAHAVHTDRADATTLIHVDSNIHTFAALTEAAATNAFYPKTAEAFREAVLKQDNRQLFYLSGSPKFVSATRTLLRENGVPKKHIKTDTFLGY